MKDLFPRLASRRTLIKTASISVIVIGLLMIAIATYVYFQAVKTFEVRRLSLPTRVYTDQTPLRVGNPLLADNLLEKLERLNYREVRSPQQPGEYVRDAAGFLIYLRAFKHPSLEHEARKIRLTIEKNSIARVDGVAEGEGEGAPVEDAAFEPELLTSILGEQLENRSPVTIDQVPKHLTDAVIVTEDVRFWQHPGVDPIGILRALIRNIRARGVAEGGSTLTQQLVKNYYLTSERTMRRKVVEAFMSLILDAKYSKREILEAYLNDIYLGRNRSISILGVGEASRFYFGKPISEMNISEAALLAGMIRSPNNYSPFANPERAQKRRDVVLGMMYRQKKISDPELQAAKRRPLPAKPFRKRSGLGSIPFYVDAVLDELERDYGIDDVKGRGLAIYTAIDLETQALATESLEAGIARLESSSRRLRRSESPLEGVLIAIDIEQGEVRALVGGRNYERSQFNRALNATRQVGSLFKPFVFLAAFEPSISNQNITPATLVQDTRFKVKQRYSKDWSPRNYNERYYGVVTVRFALEHSLNAASVRVGLATGIDGILKAAKALGIQSELESVPSIILGSVEVPPIEMAEAYTTIARMGSRLPLRSIRFVTDDRGKRLGDDDEEIEPVQVYPARDVYLAVHIMEGVLIRGTAAGARSLGFRKTAAGKTGTTNELRDAWFIGFTPKTLALTWVGFDDNTPIRVSGSDGAVPIWARFMKDATQFETDEPFAVPSGIVFAPIDSMSGGLANVYCPENMIVNEAFKAGTEPVATCPLHQPELPPIEEPLIGMYGTEPLDPADILAPEPATSLPPPVPRPPPQETTTISSEPLEPPPETTTDSPPDNPPMPS